MEAANPVKAGWGKFDASGNERREDAILRNVMASDSPVVVMVMGGNRNLGNIATRLGRSLTFDPAKEQFVEANGLIHRDYRNHWATPRGV